MLLVGIGTRYRLADVVNAFFDISDSLSATVIGVIIGSWFLSRLVDSTRRGSITVGLTSNMEEPRRSLPIRCRQNGTDAFAQISSRIAGHLY